MIKYSRDYKGSFRISYVNPIFPYENPYPKLSYEKTGHFYVAQNRTFSLC